MAFLQRSKARWRIDPVFQNLVVQDLEIASKVQKKFGFRDESDRGREFISRGQGVRVLGCGAFAGMLLYDLSDDLLYHFEAMTLQASLVPDSGLVWTFNLLLQTIQP